MIEKTARSRFIDLSLFVFAAPSEGGETRILAAEASSDCLAGH
jgi:hypothetical protein